MNDKLPELRSRAIDALQIHDGDIERATKMIAYVVTRRTYLLDAIVMDYLRRIQADPGL